MITTDSSSHMLKCLTSPTLNAWNFAASAAIFGTLRFQELARQRVASDVALQQPQTRSRTVTS